jgi:hypothetical protein
MDNNSNSNITVGSAVRFTSGSDGEDENEPILLLVGNGPGEVTVLDMSTSQLVVYKRYNCDLPLTQEELNQLFVPVSTPPPSSSSSSESA